MLTIKDLNLDKKLSVGVALAFSFEVLPLFEARYPDDLRPRKATESVIKWLQNPSKEARAAAAAAAANAAADAANAANAVYAANTGYAAYAAYVAAHAAHAAYAAANAAANAAGYAASAYDARSAVYAADAADAAAYAAYAAVNAATYTAAYAGKKRYVHDRIVKILSLILEYKIKNEQQFNNAEKVLENLSDEDKVSFLFNLDILR